MGCWRGYWYWQYFPNGIIVSSPDTCACALLGSIYEYWDQLGQFDGPLGAPMTDQSGCLEPSSSPTAFVSRRTAFSCVSPARTYFASVSSCWVRSRNSSLALDVSGRYDELRGTANVIPPFTPG